MLVYWDLGLSSLIFVAWLFPAVVFLIIHRKWRLSVARKKEIRRLMILASEETARAELEATDSYYTPPPLPRNTFNCAVCFSPTTTRCAQCKSVRYCSGKCQIIHWRQGHKEECRPLIKVHNDAQNFGQLAKQVPTDSSIAANRHDISSFETVSNKLPPASPEHILSVNEHHTIVDSDSNDRETFSVQESFGSSFSGFTTSTIDAESSGDISGCDSVNYNRSYALDGCATGYTNVDMHQAESVREDQIQKTFSPAGFFSQDKDCCNTVNSVTPIKFSGRAIEVRGVSGYLTKESSNLYPKTESVLGCKNEICGVSSNSMLSYPCDFQPPASPDTSSPFHRQQLESEFRESEANSTSWKSNRSFDGTELPEKHFTDDIKTGCLPEASHEGHIQGLKNHIGSSQFHWKDRFDATSCSDCTPRDTSYRHVSEDLSLSPPSCSANHEKDSNPRSRSSSSTNTVFTPSGKTNKRADNTKHNISTQSMSFRKDGHIENEYLPQRRSASNGIKGLRPRKVDHLKGIKYKNYIDKVIFPYDVFHKLYTSNRITMQPCGLINCGNSCYANAVLQCLTFTPPLNSYFLQGLHSKACICKKWCFTCELENLILKAKDASSPVSPIGILSHLQTIGSRLGNGREEDAHEFLRYAVDMMQSTCLKEAGVVRPGSFEEETTLVGLTFGGFLRSKIKCLRCQYKSERRERIMDLTVEIEGEVGTLEDALRKFTSTEILDGDNRYRCGRCKSYVKAKKKLTIFEAPNVLTITLKRFQAGKYGKLNKMIRFPEILDLAPFMSTSSDISPLYRLYGVVVHLDVMNASFSGHYICYIRTAQNRWFKIDDSTVTAIDFDNVLTKGGYMFLYARCSPKAPQSVANKGMSCGSKPKGGPNFESSNIEATGPRFDRHALNFPSEDGTSSMEAFYLKYLNLQRFFDDDSSSDNFSFSSHNSDESLCSTDSVSTWDSSCMSADDFPGYLFGTWSTGTRSSSGSETSSMESAKSEPPRLTHRGCRMVAGSRETNLMRSRGWTNPFRDGLTRSVLGFRKSVRKLTA